jgi:hypothetical protein
MSWGGDGERAGSEPSSVSNRQVRDSETMNHFAVIGIIAGLTAAVLSSPAVLGSGFGFALFMLVALPLFIAGLGWGWRSALIGAVTGAIVHAVVFSLAHGALFLFTQGLPVVVLSYLALLARTGDEGAVEWYPVGRLVMWMAVLAAVLAAARLVIIGADFESYATAIRTVAGDFLEALPRPPDTPEPTDEAKQAFATVLMRVLPASLTAATFFSILFNMYLAGRVVRMSDRLKRPWPDLHALTLPRVSGPILVGTAVVAFAPGLIGLAAGAFAAAFVAAFALVGLSIVHALTVGHPLRAVLLGGVYMLLVLFVLWPALLLAILGLADVFVDLRRRRQGGPPPPAGRGGPPSAPNGGA